MVAAARTSLRRAQWQRAGGGGTRRSLPRLAGRPSIPSSCIFFRDVVHSRMSLGGIGGLPARARKPCASTRRACDTKRIRKDIWDVPPRSGPRTRAGRSHRGGTETTAASLK
jgi:hypothetical protein